jgi:phosphatidylglycerol lysyltransferase
MQEYAATVAANRALCKLVTGWKSPLEILPLINTGVNEARKASNWRWAGAVRCISASAPRIATPLIALAVCGLLLVVAQSLSHSFDYHSVKHALRGMGLGQMLLAVAATVVSYAALIGRDAAALRALGVAVPRSVLVVGAVAGSALGNAAGFGALTGGAVRCRVYGSAGVGPAQVARLTLITALTFGLCLVLLGGLGALLAAPSITIMLGVPAAAVLAFGAVGLTIPAGLVLLGAATPTPVRLWRLSIEWPGRRAVLVQFLLVTIDVLAAGLSLWVLMPEAPIGFVGFLAVYAVAMLLGVAGHTPGGLGVFEAAVILAISRAVPSGPAVAALLAYRAIYFVLPLLVSAGMLALIEARGLAARLRPRVAQGVAQRPAWPITQLAPVYLAVVTFAIGVMLVFSGATPAFQTRLAILQARLPLWAVESSQLLASLTGVLLLFVANGLLRRLDAAWWLATVLAAAGLALSLAKGLAFVESGVLACLLCLLSATRRRFDRPASLFHEPLTAGWLTSIAIVIVVSFWVLFFAFREVPWSHDLCWQFAFDERASRAFRATGGAALFAAGIATWDLLRPAAGRVAPPTKAELARVASIIRVQERSDAVLAMMGDKSFLFSSSGRAFLMYVKRGRCWVALHDPIGPAEERAGLINRFVALAHKHGGRAAFYQVRAESLPLYLDAGLKLMKLGEEARLSLTEFDLGGPARSGLRYALKRGQRDGLTAEMIEPGAMLAALPELRLISDAWLQGRRMREKGFSVAALTPDSLASQSAMLLRQNGSPVAFATFMTTAAHTEATVGVMRRCPNASPYAMEYLFTRLALYLKEAGYSSLSLGMAPLAGLEPGPLARHWHWVAHLVWRHGGRIYNFRGLRAFKDKFDPIWEPRYLAASGTLGPLLSLSAVAGARLP